MINYNFEDNRNPNGVKKELMEKERVSDLGILETPGWSSRNISRLG